MYCLEPVQLDVHSNILRLEKDNQNKLTLRGIVTTTTFAEEIVVKTTLHGNGTNFEGGSVEILRKSLLYLVKHLMAIKNNYNFKIFLQEELIVQINIQRVQLNYRNNLYHFKRNLFYF